jgi:hypothetical protein
MGQRAVAEGTFVHVPPGVDAASCAEDVGLRRFDGVENGGAIRDAGLAGRCRLYINTRCAMIVLPKTVLVFANETTHGDISGGSF